MNGIILEALILKPRSRGSFPIKLADLHRFVVLPWKIPAYRNLASKKVFPLYLQELSDLNPDNALLKRFFPGAHPFFRHLEYLQYIIAIKEGFCVGRIALYIDSSYKEKDVDGKIGWLGLFECIESEEVAQQLIQKAIDTLKAEGVKKIIGPAKFNANGEVGLLIDGFEHHPMLMEPYHPPYYQNYFEKFGTKENDWFAFELDETSMESLVCRVEALQKRKKNLNDKMLSKNIKIRTICFKHLFKDVAAIRVLYNEAWHTSQHPQFEPFKEAEFRYIAKGLKIDALLYLETLRQARLYGLLRGSGSQVADINLPMVNPLRKMGKQTFTWRVYRFD